MCGIAGYFELKQKTHNLEISLKKMTDTIIHRGPDDSGLWFDPAVGIALGHRRLSILDLSPAGHQPMLSTTGRYVIVFNGEIYNFQSVRKELEDRAGSAFKGTAVQRLAWRGHSDTEVMLAAFDAWGVEEATRRFIGMFAFALWDREDRCLHLVRDRIGEKPLYYGWSGETFLFGSELKSFRAHPCWRGDINRDALALFLRHNYVPAPYSIYNGIRKLIPGTILTIRAQSMAQGQLPDPVPYWSFNRVVEQGMVNPFKGTEEEAVEQLDDLLRNAIRQQMIADVPLGAFLSGGVDSSTIVALMQAQSERPVRTFTIGFREESYNEAAYAGAVARHLKTVHTELYVTPEDALDVIPRLPALYDEPFSDSSQIPTFLVSQLTRQHVTVSLSGDAGDELFGGYNRYFMGRSIWNKIGWMPRPLRSGIAKLMESITPSRWDSIAAVIPSAIRLRNTGDRIHKLAEILAVESPSVMYRMLVSHWKEPCSIVISAREPVTVLTDSPAWTELSDFTQWMMYLDTLSYLPDDILVKVDRAAMGVSLETRVPFLDHRVVEFAWKLPLSMKIRNGQGKWILRQVLDKYVPRKLIDRPKTGFGVPIDSWLRGPLRDWAESLLSEKRLREEGFFNPAPIRGKFNEHLSGKRNWQYYLWDVLMFQAWLENIR
jgi:asparagine synthase (glutamine-hydrolysing)